jgi:hypothetical protein
MGQIFIYVIETVLAALAVRFLGLNTKRVIISYSKPISWVWKAMALIGKFMFYYGLLVFLSNLAVGGVAATKTSVGASILTFGFIFWVWGGLVVYFKRN